MPKNAPPHPPQNSRGDRPASPASGRAARPRRGFLVRLLRVALLLAFLALISVALLWGTRSSFLLPRLERWAIDEAAARGYHVETAGLSLDFQSAAIEGLTVTSLESADSNAGGLVALNATSLRAEGSLWGLATQGLSALNLVSARIEKLHLREGPDTSRAAGSKDSPIVSFSGLPHVDAQVDQFTWERRNGTNLEIQEVTAELLPEGDGATLNAQARLGDQPEALQIAGRLDSSQAKLAVELRALPLEDLAILWRGEESLQGKVTGSLLVDLSLDDPLAFRLQEGPLEVIDLHAYGFRTDRVKALASWNAGSLQLRNLQVADSNGTLDSNELSLNILDSGPHAKSRHAVLVRSAGSVFENLKGDITLQTMDLSGWLGAWIPAEQLSSLALSELLLSGRIEGLGGLFLDSGSIVARSGSGQLQNLTLQPSLNEGPASWDLARWKNFTLEGGSLTARLDDLNQWTPHLAGSLQLSATPNGLLGSPAGILHLEGSMGPEADELRPLALHMDLAPFDWKTESLEVRSLDLTSSGEILLRGRGVLPLSLDALAQAEETFIATLQIENLATHLPAGLLPSLWPGSPDFSGPLVGEVTLGTNDKSTSPRANFDVSSSALTITTRDAAGEELRIGPTRFAARGYSEGQTATLESLELTDTEKRFVIDASGSLPLAGEADGPGLSGRLEIAEVSPLLEPLSALLGMRLPLRAGSLTGTVKLEGSLSAPSIESRLSLKAGVLALGAPLPAATQVAASLRVEPGQIIIEEFRGELGASPFTASGAVSLPADGPPRLALKLKGDNLLFVRSRTLRVRADAELDLNGPVERMKASGNLLLRGGRLTAPVEFLDFSRRGAATQSEQSRGLQIFSLTEAPLSHMQFDVEVRTAEPFVIDNNVAKGAVRPSLRLTGTGQVPLLEGSIFIDPTSVSLPATRLQVKSGRVDFDRNDPFYPTLAINGETRIRGIEIEARVAGRFDDPEVYLSSSPAQPGEDLVYLLLTGQLPESSFASSSRQAAQSLAVYLAQDFVQRWFGGDADGEESIAERIDFQRGQDVSRSGAETLQASFRLKRDLTSTNDALYLTAEKDVYDHVNFGLRLVFRFE